MVSLEKSFFEYSKIEEKEELLKILKSQEETSGTQLITFYFTKLKQDTVQKIKKEVSESKNIKSKETQKIVLEGLQTLITAIEQMLKNKYTEPGVIFVKGSFYKGFYLPTYYNINLYHCDKKFKTDLLVDYIDKTWGLIVLDTKELSIGVYSNSRLTLLHNSDVFIPSKIKAGGQSASRFEETRRNKVSDFIEKASLLANEVFKNYNIDKILLGGVVPTTTNFLINNFLKPEYKKVLEGPTNTCYTNPAGLQQLIERNKEKYQAELMTYLEDKKEYDFISKYLCQTIFTKEMLKEVYCKEPKKIWALSNAYNLGYYCPTCSLIIESSKTCEHDKIDLKKTPKYYFDRTSFFGSKLEKISKIFYDQA